MKTRKLMMILLCAILIFNVTSIIAHATGINYIVNMEHLPAERNYVFYKTTLTPSNANTAITNAAATWNSEYYTMQLYYGSATKSLDTDDNYNTVGTLLTADSFAAVMGSYTYIAANYLKYDDNDRIKYFDIALNGSYSFNNGQYSSIYDYQGIITHELGHVWGLSDVYENSEVFSVSNVNELPTMFGEVNYSGYSGNISIFLRDLQTADVNGLAAVKELCGY